MPANDSPVKVFVEIAQKYPQNRAQLHRVNGQWTPILYREFLQRAAVLAFALEAFGHHAGDRVAIFAPNCPEWHVADFAIQGIGGVVVPVYFNESPEHLVYVLNDSGARIAIVSGEMQARRLAECRSRLSSLERIICVNPPQELRADFVDYQSLVANSGDTRVAQFCERVSSVSPSDLATIIYTSGTTGEPKGVMLTHANLSSNAFAFSKDFGLSTADLALSVLPLAHVYERTIDYGYLFNAVPIAYVEQIETVAQALLEVSPTIMSAVPRLYEKTYAAIIEKGRRTSGVKRWLFEWSLRIAQEAVPWKAYGTFASSWLKARWKIADDLVYAKFRAGLGGRIRILSAGGAPLARELGEFFWVVGLPVYQGYGLTETSPVVAANTPKWNKVGTVGRPVQDVQVRIADDGEILVKGPCVMRGYYNKPQQTKEVLSEDGWFSTGDIGHLDTDGFLVITDRKKELLKTAGGKFVAPAPIENQLKTSPFISNAIVVGDGRKFVSVLIVPNFTAVEGEGRKFGRDVLTPGQMTSDPWVRDLISHEIERLTQTLAQYEKPKRFAILEKDFTYATGELTYTLKLKRRVIAGRYQDVIARLYDDVEDPRPPALP